MREACFVAILRSFLFFMPLVTAISSFDLSSFLVCHLASVADRLVTAQPPLEHFI